PSPFSRSPAHPHSPSFPTTTLFRSLLVVRQVHPERAERLTTSVSNYAVLRTAIIDATYPRDLPRKRALRVLTAGLRGLLARGADHHAFLDHVDDVVGVDGVEEEDLVRSEEHTSELQS